MKQLLWHQPTSYHRAIYLYNERVRPLDSAKFAGGSFLALLGVRFVAGMRPAPDAHPPGWGSTAAVAALVAIFLAYGLPALMSLFSGSIIILSDKGINKNKRVGLGWAIRFWEWDQVAYFSFNDDPIGGRNYRILQAHDAHGEVLVSAALGQDPTEQEIKSFLQAHGKPLHDVLSVVQDQVSTLRS